MADERVGTRDFDTRKSLSWTELFRTFLIALDPFKLLVAAVGILATALGWWLISVIFYHGWSDPKAPDKDIKDEKAAARAEAEYYNEQSRHNFMRELAGPGGVYRTMPWAEERGRNPFLIARSAVGSTPAAAPPALDGKKTVSTTPERRGGVIDWFLTNQAPVLIEPLLKFLSPVLGLFDSSTNVFVRIYLFLLILWMLTVWAFFGGILTRMAIVQIAGKEGGGLRDAVRFVKSRYLSYLSSPIVPILLIFAVVLGCILFGFFHLIPLFGDIIVDGLFWWIPLGAGFVMALLVVGLVGYPLMYATLSAEGSDTFDALSRSYNYVYESPWYYIWYGFVSIVYGAVVVFFVVFMSSLMVYLGKWGVSQTPLTQTVNRSPEYLFIYTPTSFGWRELMLQGSPAAIMPNPNYGYPAPTAENPNKIDREQYVPRNAQANKEYMDDYSWYNYAGAGMVAFWMTLLFMLMLGFSYSYFWTASSMIYLLMRKKVDEVEVDEIYTEDEDFEEPIAPKPPAPAAPSGPTSVPIEAPTLRVSTPPATPTLPVVPSTPVEPPVSTPPPTEPPPLPPTSGTP
ncbi:MAG: hypothetical protein K8T89_06950 [Planctomycetes bacterium]|nr:hypothetical protein [Planctomycetota bacterium]